MKSMLVKLFGWVLRKIWGAQKAHAFADFWHERRGGNASAPEIRRQTELRFHILFYHRVLPRADLFSLRAVETSRFEQQIEFVAECFRIVSLPQLVREIEGGALQPNTVCVTFDDGYRDNYTYAYPILKKYSVPATIFLTTGVLGSQKLLWHDRVFEILRATKIRELEWRFEEKSHWRLQHAEERARFATRLLGHLKSFPPPLRDREIAKLMSACGIRHEELSGKKMLTWEEVKEMQSNNISFGAHTVTHPILSLLTDEELWFEISESKRAIEQQLGEPVGVFAYPNGQRKDFDARTKHILKSCGFRCAVTTLWGMNTPADDPFEWRRATPWETEINGFAARIFALRSF